MMHKNLWPLPTVFRLLDLRVTKKESGLGLVFEIDVTDGRAISTWRFLGVSLVRTLPLEIDEDAPTSRSRRFELPS